ncbi:hypothetical protein ACNKHN_02665 [Shigella flexneri]
MFSFGGLELIGMTAASGAIRKKHPESSESGGDRTAVLYRFTGGLLALYPWVEVKSNSSPFVMIFHNLDSNVVAFCAELRHFW